MPQSKFFYLSICVSSRVFLYTTSLKAEHKNTLTLCCVPPCFYILSSVDVALTLWTATCCSASLLQQVLHVSWAQNYKRSMLCVVELICWASLLLYWSSLEQEAVCDCLEVAPLKTLRVLCVPDVASPSLFLTTLSLSYTTVSQWWCQEESCLVKLAQNGTDGRSPSLDHDRVGSWMSAHTGPTVTLSAAEHWTQPADGCLRGIISKRGKRQSFAWR